MSEGFNILYFALLTGFIFYFLIDHGEHRKPLIFNIIKINFMGKKYHLHHWINFSILLVLMMPSIFIYGYNTIILSVCGICLGCILQGLTYKDAFTIRMK